MLSIRYKPSMPVSLEVVVRVLARDKEFPVFHVVSISIVSSEMCVCAFEALLGEYYFICKSVVKERTLLSGHPMLITSPPKASLKHSGPIPIAKWFSSSL